MLDPVIARLPLALLVLAACSTPSQPERAAPTPDAAPPPSPSREQASEVPVATPKRKLPTSGCALADTQDLTEGTRALASWEQTGPAVYAWSSDARTLARWTREGSGRLVVGSTVAFPEPIARAALVGGATTEVAAVDTRGQLLHVTHATSGFSKPRTLARGVDRRFAPALARTRDVVLTAYVASPREAAGAMHTMFSRVARRRRAT